MCGGKGTTVQQTTIPPEVLARYNAVNAYAEQVAKQPFQRYGGEFVAPINEQQMMGINAINQSANMAQPYFNQATSALNSAYGQATPLYGQSLNTIGNAVNQGQNYYNQSLASMQGGLGQAQNYYANALSQIGQGGQQANSMYNQSLVGIGNALNQAQSMYGDSLSSMYGGALRANNLYDLSLGNISSGLNIGSKYGTDATQFFNQAGSSAQPYMSQSGNYVTAGLGAASPLMSQAQQYLQGGTQAVNAEEFGAGQVQKYMSPYMSQVINAQTKLAEQQNAIQRSALNSQAIGSGAFGGDRAGIAQANLAGQQSLSQQATMGNLLQQGYGQALGAFQQQQGVNLMAQQANRAAQQYGQQAAAQMAQQAFGQNLAASQQMGNLGQALFGQKMAQGEAMSNLGQQLYAQNIGAANARNAIAQNQFGMSAQQAAMQQQAAQGMFGMQAQQAALQQQAAQGMFGISAQQAAMQQQTGQSMFNMSAQQAAMQQAAAQGMFGMQAQQAALQQQAAQGMYGMGMQYAQGLAGLGMGAQSAALQAAQAQIGAGTLQQQTQQAQDTAQYQQFLQERGYPFQVAQFLANIAMGTGALSGSTTTSTGPMGYGSDRRLKKDIKEIGETHDGLPIYSFKYKEGDQQQRIGVMSDDVRQKHPDAVHNVGGVDSVDYEKIANRASEGGGVMPHHAGEGYSRGGTISEQDIASIVAAQKEMYGPHAKGTLGSELPGSGGIVPQKFVQVARLQPHSAPPQQQGQRGLAAAASAIDKGSNWNQRLLGKEGLFGEQGPFSKEGTLRKTFASLTGPSNQQQPQGSSQGQPASTQQPAQNPADLPSSKGKTVSFDRNDGQYFVPPGPSRAGGVMPTNTNDDKVVDLEKGTDYYPTDDLSSVDFARGGVIPRQRFSRGSQVNALDEKVLPYQSDEKYGPEDVNETESGKQIEKLDDDSKGIGGGGKKGPSPISLGMKAAGMAANFIPGVGPFIGTGLNMASNFFNNGGVVPSKYYAGGGGIRPAFATRGGVDSEMSDEEYAIRTAAAETSGNPDETRGIAHVIYNRAQSGNYGGKSYRDVVLAPNQFEPWQTQNNNPMNIKTDDPRYIQAKAEFEKLHAGDYDPRFADTYNFWGPKAQEALGRPAPSWGRGPGTDVGGTRFHNLEQVAASKAMAPTEGGVKPSDGAQRQVAGAQYDRDSGKTYVNGKEEKGGLGAAAADLLTSTRFWAPVGAGLLQFASSPNRYKWGAIAEGIGAGLGALQPAEAAAQDITGKQITNVGAAIDLNKKSFQIIDGNVWVTMPNGEPIPYSAWKKAGSPTPIGGRASIELIEKAAKDLNITSGAPTDSDLYKKKSQTGQGTSDQNGSGTATGAPAAVPGAPQAPTAPKPGEPLPNAPQYPMPSKVTVPQSALTAAQNELNAYDDLSEEAKLLKVQENQKIQERANAAVAAAADMTRSLNDLAIPLSNMAGTQQVTPGPLAKPQAAIYGIWNNLVQLALKDSGMSKEQLDSYKFDTQGLTDYQLAEKASVLATSELARQLGDKAVTALQVLGKGFANSSMDADAARGMLAEAILKKTMAMEEGLFTKKYNANIDPNRPVGSNAGVEFRKVRPDEEYFLKELPMIKDVMSRTVGPNNESLLTYLMGRGKNAELQKIITPEWVNRQYGRDIARHFLNTSN